MDSWTPLKTADSRVMMIFNDFVIKYDMCNFRCEYCLNKLIPYDAKLWINTETSVRKNYTEESNEEQKYIENEPFVYSTSSSLGKRINALVNAFDKAIDTPVLRLSGGEVLQIKGIERFIEKISNRYEVVQIVTNGYFLTKYIIDRIKNIGNCHLHYSLDGHNLQLNRYRVKSGVIQKRLMENLDNAVKAGIPVEINSVMTSANTKNFMDFLNYLLRYEGKVVVHSSPVRGRPLRVFYPEKESIKSFSNILSFYEKYKSILPPVAYIETLVEFMNNNKRELQCHLAKAAIQSIDDGNLTPCPNRWTVQIGNLFRESAYNIISRVGKEKIYNLLLQKKPRLDFCKRCYTAYDVINLYINGRISDVELKYLPLYSGPRVNRRMQLLKSQYLQSNKTSIK